MILGKAVLFPLIIIACRILAVFMLQLIDNSVHCVTRLHNIRHRPLGRATDVVFYNAASNR